MQGPKDEVQVLVQDSPSAVPPRHRLIHKVGDWDGGRPGGETGLLHAGNRRQEWLSETVPEKAGVRARAGTLAKGKMLAGSGLAPKNPDLAH